jgi:hypothetical protein
MTVAVLIVSFSVFVFACWQSMPRRRRKRAIQVLRGLFPSDDMGNGRGR